MSFTIIRKGKRGKKKLEIVDTITGLLDHPITKNLKGIVEGQTKSGIVKGALAIGKKILTGV